VSRTTLISPRSLLLYQALPNGPPLATLASHTRDCLPLLLNTKCQSSKRGLPCCLTHRALYNLFCPRESPVPDEVSQCPPTVWLFGLRPLYSSAFVCIGLSLVVYHISPQCGAIHGGVLDLTEVMWRVGYGCYVRASSFCVFRTRT